MLMCERSGVLGINKGHRSDTDNEGGATLTMRGREWSDTEMITICGVCVVCAECVCKCVVCACVRVCVQRERVKRKASSRFSCHIVP